MGLSFSDAQTYCYLICPGTYQAPENFLYPNHIWNFARFGDNFRSWQVIFYSCSAFLKE
jgi:hypothetical protein